MKPKVLESEKAHKDYCKDPDPYKEAPYCNVNLLELSRYAKQNGKSLVELSKEEVEQFKK